MVNDINGLIYIGVTNVAEYRIKQHLGNLLRGKHSNKLLQEDFDKYGFVFTFYLIEDNIPENISRERERYWMDAYSSNIKGRGYNLSKQEAPKDIRKCKKIFLEVLRGSLLSCQDSSYKITKEDD